MYAIVDIETTGTNDGYHGITEVAIFIHDGEQVIDSWQSLINPQVEIPAFMQQMTGITNDRVATAPYLKMNNPGCPFVRKHYQGNMQALQKKAAAQGVVWLAINSTETASGDYLSPAQLARWMADKQAAPTATLMDEDGAVGKAYGARVTPHMYIVDARGTLVYAGGIDSIASSDAWTTSPRPPRTSARRWPRSGRANRCRPAPPKPTAAA